MENACFKRKTRAPEPRTTRAGIIAGVSCLVAAVSFAAGCEQASESRGQLVIAFQTDMALPTQIDNVRVQLTRRGGEVLLMDAYSIGGSPNDNPIPGSLVLVAGANPEPITITVAGSKSDLWRTYREIVTTVPRDRVAMLRMPIQWLCNESAQPQVVTVPDGKGGQVSRVVQTCPDGETCKAGACVSNETDSATLPDFDPMDLYGGAEEPEQGACFDVVECMGAGTAVVPDANCTIERPAGENVNVALRVAGGGICNDAGPVTTCFVPLDGEDAEGWTTTPDGSRIQLPVEVCNRLAERKVLAVQSSTACQTKSPALPPCGAWSVVPDSRAIVPDTANGAPSWPSPELFASLPAANSEYCCPLMSEGTKLYSCMCVEGKEEATVFAVDMESEKRDDFPIPATPNIAASVYEGTLYWAESSGGAPGEPDVIYRLPLQPGAAPTGLPLATAGVGLYTDSRLLTDASGIHVMASGLGKEGDDAALADVYLLHFNFNGMLTGMDALGDRVIKQIAQDASSFYAGVNVDERRDDTQPFLRMSSVVRIEKAMHQVTTLLNPQPMTIPDFKHNGYLGVVSDGTDLFTLFESPPTPAGTEHLEIGRIAMASTATTDQLDVIYDLEVPAERHLTALRLLGAVDGAVFFARDEYLQPDRLRSSSVLAIPKGATSARFIADFTADVPIQGIAASSDKIFWMNQSGRIFALSREALAP